MRLFSTLGPGDIVGAHRTHVSGETIRNETSIVFSEQLIEYSIYRDIDLLAIGTHPRVDRMHDGRITLEQQSKPFSGRGGLAYHLGELLYAIRVVTKAKRFFADMAVIDSGTTHWFALWLFALVRIPVVVNFHNVLWPHGFQPQGIVSRSVRRLDATFLRHGVSGLLGCSPECHQQAEQLAGRPLPYEEWRAQFRHDGFAKPSSRSVQPTFNVIFVGRAELSKGVADIPHIARIVKASIARDITFEVCGDGGGLEETRRLVAELEIGDRVFIHGRVEREQLLAIYARSDAVIIPTRGTFSEGMPLVCAEAIISGKPIITSVLSNAIPILGPAIAEAMPEDIQSFADRIIELAASEDYYRDKSSACVNLTAQFFDRTASYPAAFDRLLGRIRPGWRVLPSYVPIFEALESTIQR